MSLNAVQQQIQSYINGLTSLGYAKPIDARVQQPVADFAKLDTPIVFVWGSTGSESRVAIPRGPGWKQDAHKVSLWVFGLSMANDPNRAWKFPVLIQTVRNALATASPMPVQITDPQTRETSTLLNLGEEFTWDYDIDRSLADQRLVRNIARIDVSVLEEFRA